MERPTHAQELCYVRAVAAGCLACGAAAAWLQCTGAGQGEGIQSRNFFHRLDTMGAWRRRRLASPYHVGTKKL
jgi:hypothetical protein